MVFWYNRDGVICILEVNKGHVTTTPYELDGVQHINPTSAKIARSGMLSRCSLSPGVTVVLGVTKLVQFSGLRYLFCTSASLSLGS